MTTIEGDPDAAALAMGWARADDPCRNPEDERPSPHGMGWRILMGVNLAVLVLLFGYGAVDGLLALLHIKAPAATPSGQFQSTLWFSVAFTVVTMVIVPLLWSCGTRCQPWEGTLRYFRLHDVRRGCLRGLGWGALLVLGLLVIGAAITRLVGQQDNPQADEIIGALDWPLALALALSAAAGEEVFFRGYLQRRLGRHGYWWQAGLFALAHLSYATPLQLLFPLALGLLFGWMVKRGWPLWTPIVAHFVFDFVQFAAGIAARSYLQP